MVVIYRASGFDIEHPDRFMGDSGMWKWVLYPRIAADGSTIWFKKRELFSTQWQTYDIAKGVLRDVDPEYIWETADFEFNRTDVPLCAPAPVKSAPVQNDRRR